MKVFVVLAAVCVVAVHSSPLFGDNSRSNIFQETAGDAFCIAANTLKQAGWMNSDGTMSKRFYESENARECNNLVGSNPCDTADRIMSCMSNRGLITAAKIATFPFGGALVGN